MLTAGLIAVRVQLPRGDGDLKLFRDEVQNQLSRGTQFPEYDLKGCFAALKSRNSPNCLYSPETHFGVSGNATTWKPS